MDDNVELRDDLGGIDWATLKSDLASDHFDNGRSPEALQRSFEASPVVAIAWLDGRVVGTARALTDGVCNAYVVDVWTRSDLRRRGIGRELMRTLTARLNGQHVGLFTSDAAAFYQSLQFEADAGGFSKVVGKWLSGEA